jgi:hypothetical protein
MFQTDNVAERGANMSVLKEKLLQFENSRHYKILGNVKI